MFKSSKLSGRVHFLWLSSVIDYDVSKCAASIDVAVRSSLLMKQGREDMVQSVNNAHVESQASQTPV